MYASRRIPFASTSKDKKTSYAEISFEQQFCYNSVEPNIIAVFQDRLLTHIKISYNVITYIYQLTTDQTEDWVTYVPNKDTMFNSTCGWKIDKLKPTWNAETLLFERKNQRFLKIGDLFDDTFRPAQCPKTREYGALYVDTYKIYLRRVPMLYPALC